MVGWACLSHKVLKKSLLPMEIIMFMKVYSNTD